MMQRMTARLLASATLCAMTLMVGCGGDEVTENNATTPAACPEGQVRNPISGECMGGEPENNQTPGNQMPGNQMPGNQTPGNQVDNSSDNSSQNSGNSSQNSGNSENSSQNSGNSSQNSGNSSQNSGNSSQNSGNNMNSMANNMGNNTMADPCEEGADSDGDGLENDCECDYGTDPFVADTDGDGLSDGDEDVDKDCDPIGESDARYPDTDSDGVSDKDELENGLDVLSSDSDGDGLPDGVEFNGCTDPLMTDSDGDSLPDGTEDGNFDGEIGVCMNRMYDPACAAGESDPCKADTDNDGTLDKDEVIYRTCRDSDKQGLTQPQLIENMTANYTLAAEASVASAPLTSATATVQAHVFEDPTHEYTGFVISLPVPAAGGEAQQLADHVFTQVLAVPDYSMSSRRSAGRQITTHDNYKAIVDGVIDLPPGTAPEVARDKILAQLTGASDLTSSLTSTIAVGAMEPSLFHYEVIARSASEYVLVAAIAPLNAVEDEAKETGFRVDDIVNGTSIAGAGETLTADCVSFKVTEKPKVDIIISMDASGSMSDEQMALSNFVTDLTTFLTAANLDWRIGVTSVACDNIKQDTALSQEFRDIFPMSSGGFGSITTCALPFGGGFGMGGGANGTLVKQSNNQGGFTTDVSQIRWRVENVNGTNSEFTVTMGAAAVDRALPRSDSNPDKIREEAAIIVIAVTDEEDEFFKEELSFLPVENPDAAQRMQLEMATAPFIEHLLDPEVGATVFGLYNVPNSDCPTAAQFASAIHDIVTKTGGSGGSICQSDITTSLQAIASATAGIASGLRLRGSAVPPTIEVKHAQVMTGMEIDVPRSRADGFDYDGIVNRVAFYGPMPPQTNDRLVIPYLRWENSVFMCMDESDCPSEQKLKCIDGECR